MFANKLAMLLTMLFLTSSVYAGYVGSAQLHVPAVLSSENQGTLTIFNLTVTNGTGAISIVGPTNVGTSTQQSASIAVQYAASYLKVNESKYNFTYHIEDTGTNVSGPSGGLAFTILAISALEHKQLLDNFTLTGTISPDGTVGAVGGVYDKANIALQKGMSFIIVPNVTAAQGGGFYNSLYYIIDKSIGIPVVEVSNVSQALPYAFGEKAPTQLTFVAPANYSISSLKQANLTCTDCNISQFSELLNFTFNITQAQIDALPSSYSQARQSLSGALSNYKGIGSRGYLYVAADQSYLMYIDAFLLSHNGDIVSSSAYSTIENISSYCNSISPPQMTSTNYEYVIGGEVRQTWANQTINSTLSAFNSSGDSDQMLASVYSAAPALGWCMAANQMYKMAALMNGTPVETSQNLTNQAKAALASDPPGQYSAAALQDYNYGYYAASLYNSAYSKALDKPFPSTLNGTMLNATSGYINNATFGIWANQLALSSQFYLYQEKISTSINQSISDQNSAISTSMLAYGLSSANARIAASFVQLPAGSSVPSAQINRLESQVQNLTSELYYVFVALTILAVVVIILLILLMRIMLNQHAPNNKRKSGRKQV